MRLWRVRRLDGFADKRVEAVGQVVAALIAVERWGERSDVDAFLYSSLVPSRFA